LPLTNKQKNYILKKKKKLSTKEMSKKLNVPVNEVDQFISTIKEKKYPFYYNLILLRIPILVLVLLETGLRYFDYGKDYSQWLKVDDKKMVLNPEIAFRYFYNIKSVPEPSQDLFDIEKKTNSFRVFIVGGSSAAGYPFSPSGSFAKYISKRLELLYPDRTIEVINTAMSAINSYTLRDLFQGILEEHPDVILIYAGHNEYYGALGTGSMESLGSSRSVVNFMLSLNKYKTTQLLRNFIKSSMKIFSGDEKTSGTLMSRMAEDQLIELNSDVYNRGVDQFEGNLKDMFEMANESGVPIIISNLTSNLKDQKPFVSIEDGDDPSADEIYNKGTSALARGLNNDARNQFYRAKDLDALRFRAPRDINNIIELSAYKYNYPVVDADSVFNELSPNGIVGSNLMTDHLHPTIEGYQILGKLFFQEMVRNNLLPKGSPTSISLHEQDEIIKDNFDLTGLDSTIARYRIIILKGDWPFVEKKISLTETLKKLNAQTYSDSLAMKVLNNKLSWEKAHRDLAAWFLRNNRVDQFLKEIDAVIFQFPFIYEYYQIVINVLLDRKMYDEAYPYLLKYYQSHPDGFSAKWIGIIDLNKKNIERAIKYLEKSVKYNPNDSQVLYNIAGAYSLEKNYKKALDTISRCLQINPNHQGAKNLQKQLLAISKQINRDL